MGNILKSINKEHCNSNFIERLACLSGENNAIPESRFLNEQPYSYVLGVSNRIYSIEKCFAKIDLNKKMVLNPPPSYWMDEINFELDSFYMERFELFLLSVISAADGIFHLINEVYLLGLQGKDVTPKKIKSLVANLEVNSSVDRIMNATKEIRSKRNLFVHQLKSPHLKILSEISRMRQVIGSFKMKKNNITYNYAEGVNLLILIFDEYTLLLNDLFESVCNTLVGQYEVQIDFFGGIYQPNEQEIKLAQDVLSYFDGGDMPAHWKK